MHSYLNSKNLWLRSPLGKLQAQYALPFLYTGFFIQVAAGSIRSARECASCVQLACLSLYSSRLGLSDQREIAPAVYSSLAVLFSTRDSVYQISARLCLQPALCLLAVQGSSDGAMS